MKQAMKKTLRVGAVTAGALCALTASAFAAEVGDDGVYALKTDTGYSIEMQTAQQAPIKSEFMEVGGVTGGFYQNAERFTLSYRAQAPNAYQMVLVLKGDSAIPAADNIVYIDQNDGKSQDVSFEIYPSALAVGEKYHVYITAQGGSYEEVASFCYGTVTGKPSYRLGDVNGDGEITSKDSLWILESTVNMRTLNEQQKAAANVTKDDAVDSKDALWIAESLVGMRDAF